MPDNLYNLVSFADCLLLPVTGAFAGDAQDVWHAGAVVEAFLWLDLGAKVGAFPIAESRLLADSVARSVMTALNQTPTLRTLFSEYHLQIVDRSFQGGHYFERDIMAYTAGRDLDRPFETVLLFAMDFGRDRRAQAFCEVATLASEEQWQRLISDHVDVPMLEESDEDTDRTRGRSTADVFSGLVACLDYLKDADYFLTTLKQDERYDAAGRLALVGDAAAIQSWRLNFSLAAVRDRVAFASDLWMQAISAEHAAFNLDSSVTEFCAAGLRDETVNLMDRWKEHCELVPTFAIA